MFYCTIYTRYSRDLHLIACLSYASKADAEKFRDFLVNQVANRCDIRVEGEYTTITGAIVYNIWGFDIRNRTSGSAATYVIGIEDSSTRFSKTTDIEKDPQRLRYVIKDGLEFERKLKQRIQQRAEEAAVEKENEASRFNKIVSELELNLKDKNTLEDILHELIRAAERGKAGDKTKLVEIAAAKIRGEAQGSDWYSELSEINS